MTFGNRTVVWVQSQRLAAKAARAGGGAQRSESDADEPGGSGGGKLHNGLLSLPDPSTWPFAAALRGDSIADGDERHLQVISYSGSGRTVRFHVRTGLGTLVKTGCFHPRHLRSLHLHLLAAVGARLIQPCIDRSCIRIALGHEMPCGCCGTDLHLMVSELCRYTTYAPAEQQGLGGASVSLMAVALSTWALMQSL